MGYNIIEDKSFNFSIKIIKLYKQLRKNNFEYVLANQLLKSGTSIGANVREAQHGQSKKDFLSKMNIALKEAYETEYWLELLIATNYIEKAKGELVLKQCVEVKKILHAIVKKIKNETHGV